MKYTSAEAAKLLRQLNDDYYALILKEEQSREFLAAVGEDIESVRPEYNYAAVQKRLAEMEEKIRKVKHAINVFNTTHIVPGFEITIDQVLILIPQLTNKRNRLAAMKSKLPKVRENAGGRISTVIDYRYTNYDISEAEKDYAEVSSQLSKAQTALDVVNNTETMEIDL